MARGADNAVEDVRRGQRVRDERQGPGPRGEVARGEGVEAEDEEGPREEVEDDDAVGVDGGERGPGGHEHEEDGGPVDEGGEGEGEGLGSREGLDASVGVEADVAACEEGLGYGYADPVVACVPEEGTAE